MDRLLTSRTSTIYRGITPKIDASVFIAGGAWVIGDVEIGAGSSVWYGAVVRGDVNEVRVGSRVNIQDGAVIHVARRGQGTYIEDDVTIGHGAVLHACNIEARCLIGLRASVLDGARVESGAMVAAGAVVTPRKVVPSGELWAGVPAVKLRDLTREEIDDIAAAALRYADLAREYQNALLAEQQRRLDEENMG